MKNILIPLATFSVLSFSNISIANTEIDLKAALKQQQQQLQAIEKQLLELKAEKSRTAENFVAKTLNESDKNWQIKSYGSMLYKSKAVFKNTQDIDPEQRATTDLERVVIEFAYDFDAKWQVELEIEYEHGGTGVTLEYDGFDEFGEFETEIEAGGEVIVEKLEVKYQYNENISVKIGHITVPVGIGTDLHKPNQYFTTERHWSEATLIPQVWHETGINVSASWHNFTAQTLITTGLNSEYFRTHHWVATGHQTRFEQVNSDDLALTFRLDYGNIKSGSSVGISLYNGNTSGNRNKTNKISGDGNLTLIGLHGVWEHDNWLARGQYLFGQLDDSQAITKANKTTAGLKPGVFAQLGSEAEAAFVEVAYDSKNFFGLTTPLYLFTAYEYANPIKKLAEGTPTARFDTQEISFGVNYFPTKNLVFKGQVSQQNYAQDNLDDTHSFSLSIGYYFSI
ncbi:MAG: hypothetical protein HRT51_07520 [Colwellia sp.]|nr:hypothetical protein [Colwellia sp.]